MTETDDTSEVALGLALTMRADPHESGEVVATLRPLGMSPYVLVRTRARTEDDPDPTGDVGDALQVILDVETGGGVPQDVEMLAGLLEMVVSLLREDPESAVMVVPNGN